MRYTTDEPKWEAQLALLGNSGRFNAEDSSGLQPGIGDTVGVDMKIDHKPVATGESKCLLQTPKWNFNWQRAYAYDAEIDDLPTVRPGDELVMRCTYNNTMANPFVAEALAEQGLPGPVEVRLGEETLDEMCLGVFGVLVPPGLL